MKNWLKKQLEQKHTKTLLKTLKLSGESFLKTDNYTQTQAEVILGILKNRKLF